MHSNIRYRVLGVMSGTSLDGIDLAICNFTKAKKWSFNIEKTKTVNYSNYWKKKLELLHTKSNETIKKTDIEYGRFLGKKIIRFLKDETIELIASHGHTIFHQPENNYTLQIGNGSTIARITQIKTINNFRNLDVSLNGQGAPLVAIGDLLLFSDYKYCINIGGFANISIKEKHQIKAFDICPTNIILNKLSKRLNLEFDKNGNIAKTGKIIPKLLEELNNLHFYKTNPPKSLSREWIEKFVNPLLLQEYKTKDILHTFCEHIAIQIGKYLDNNSALFTGGGSLNSYLMKRISYYSNSKICIPNKKIINFKEALIFAFLGILKLRNEKNCLKSVTGAKHDNCGGEINNPL